jgi:DNA repair protein RadA/Sms
VFQTDSRLRELATHGITKAIVPKKPPQSHGVKCYSVDEVTKLIDWM